VSREGSPVASITGHRSSFVNHLMVRYCLPVRCKACVSILCYIFRMLANTGIILGCCLIVFCAGLMMLVILKPPKT
jgi:hypothetical protein